MSAADPIVPETRRFSIPLPSPLWIGLATGILVVVAIGLQLGIPVYRQQVVIQEIERLGGSVLTEPFGPEWLRSWMGGEWMMLVDTVNEVYLNGSAATDATLGYLSCLTGLMNLWLNETNVTDAGLVHLNGFRSLQHLALINTQVTDAGLEHLARTTDLRDLILNNTQITDVGLGQLKGLPKLQMLCLDDTRATDAGLAYLKGSTSLEVLTLSNTQVTDAGLVNLTGLTELHSLTLDKTQVSDAGLVHLRGLTEMEQLSLRNTQVTHEGLAELKTPSPARQAENRSLTGKRMVVVKIGITNDNVRLRHLWSRQKSRPDDGRHQICHAEPPAALADGILLLCGGGRNAIRGSPSPRLDDIDGDPRNSSTRVDKLSALMAYVRAVCGAMIAFGSLFFVTFILNRNFIPLTDSQIAIRYGLGVLLCVGIGGGLLTYCQPFQTTAREKRIRLECGEILGICADPARIQGAAAQRILNSLADVSASQNSDPFNANPVVVDRRESLVQLTRVRAMIALGHSRDSLERRTDELLAQIR